MLKSYFKLAWRHITKHKAYSFVSIIGLAFGICCTLFISLYVQDEVSYDQFHEKKDRIYRITELLNHNGEINAALTSFPVGPTFTNDYPEIESFVRFMSMGNEMTIKLDDKIFRETNFWMTDTGLFDVMSYQLLQGDPKTALSAPRSIVLSEELAIKYFDSPEKALGEKIQVGVSEYDVTGVIENSPSNSEIVYKAFISLSTLPQASRDAFNQDWFRLVCYTFLLFNESIEPDDFREKMDDFSTRYVEPFVATFGEGSSASFYLQPMEELHFDNSREYDLPKGNMNFIYIFVLLAVFILAIASINYINLSLSQSIKRAKEVGVRKTLGAYKSQISGQFLGESLLITFIAFVLGLAMVEIMLGFFNEVTGKEFSFSSVLEPDILITTLVLIFLVGLLSGVYPALVLSRFEPSNVLRGNLPKIGRFGNLRRALMLMQFIFSLFMIIGTISIYQQMKYMQEKELGFDKDQTVVITIPQDTAVFNKLAYFKSELLQYPDISKITGSGGMPGRNFGELMFRIEQDGQMVDKNIKVTAIDEDYLEVLNIGLVAGRAFSQDIQTDVQQGFIINEEATRKFGWNEDAVGKRMQWGLLGNGQAQFDGKVVGVIKDFHFASLHNQLEPLVMLFRPNFSSFFSVKLKGGAVEESLEIMEEKWKEFAGNHDFQFQFLDERIEAQYSSEKILLSIFSFFALISLIIAALGLFALTSFTVEQRIKEISVRKILGAKLKDLALLISKEFLILLAIAVLLISPVAYYAIDYWLGGFVYKIPIPVFGFLLAALLAFFITMLTISYHIFIVSKTNPARTLRSE